MDVAKLVLQYFQVLAWPVIVGWVLFWLREPIRRKIADVLKVKLPGVEAEFAAAAAQLEEQIAESASILTDPIPSMGSQDEPSAPSPVTVHSGDTPGPESKEVQRSERLRREAVVEIVRDAVRIGFDLGRTGTDITPIPNVLWDLAGKPRVLIESGEAQSRPSGYENSVLQAFQRVVPIGSGSLSSINDFRSPADFVVNWASGENEVYVIVKWRSGRISTSGFTETVRREMLSFSLAHPDSSVLFVTNGGVALAKLHAQLAREARQLGIAIGFVVWTDESHDDRLLDAVRNLARK